MSGAETNSCRIRGCLNPATTFLSSAWYPDVQWIVCDDCAWTVDMTFVESCHENSAQDVRKSWSQQKQARTAASILGSSLGLVNESRCFPLHCANENTTLSEAAPSKFIKSSFVTLGENAVCGTTETWHQLEKVLSLRKLASPRRNKKCNIDGCTLDACSLWSTWKRSENFEWVSMSRVYVCVDCQEDKFGGWPNLRSLLGKGYMTQEKLKIIASKCSKQQCPALPPALIKSLS